MHFLVVFLCFSSVFISYEKANSCYAVGVALEVGAYVIFTGIVLTGAYVVATNDDVQSEIKDTFTDYKNATVENSKMLYETNKQLFNDFVAYAEENGAGSMCLYSSAGSSYTVAELSQAGFPDFNEWDDYFKKSSGSGGGWKNIFDKILLGADLIGLMKSFCNDEFYEDGLNGQLFFTGDEGYINRETGEVNIYFEGRKFCHYNNVDFDTVCAEFIGDGTDLTSRFDAKIFRICVAPHRTYSSNAYYHWGDYSRNPVLNYRMQLRFYYVYKESTGLYIADGDYCNFSSNGVGISFPNGFSLTFGTQFALNSTSRNLIYDKAYYEPWGRNFENSDWGYFPDYISSNIPYFANYSDARNYLLGKDLEPTNSLGTTPSDLFLSNYSGDYITVNNVITDVNNYYDVDGDEPSATPLPDVTIEPLPTLPDDDGSNTTNNYIINITNILQPIQQTVTNIYNFFIIDTEKIVLEIDNIDVTPASKFTNFVQTFSNLKNIFSDSTQDELNVAGSSQKGIVYPILKVQCPKILTDFLPDNDDVVFFEDDIAYIILCDCGKYAVQFGAVRLILKAVMWFGFIFYVLRELKVVITLSS